MRMSRNAEFRKRLKNLKKSNDGAFAKMMAKVGSITGADVSRLLSDEQINKILEGTFKKFDRDNSGELEMGEFHKAWKLLKLKGSTDEVDRAFYQVDTNNSGRIDMQEFIEAIKNNRAAELSTTLIMQEMEGQLDGLDNIFAEYKVKQ